MSSKLQLLEFYTTHDLKSSDLPVSKFHPASSIYYTLSNQVLGLVDRKSKSLTFPTKTLEPMYIKTYDHEHRDDGDDDGTYYFKIRPYNHDILVKYHDGRMFTREGDNMVQFLPYQQDFRASAMRTASLIDVANVKYISVGGSNYVITTTTTPNENMQLTVFDAQGRDINTPIEFAPDFYTIGACASTLQPRRGIITSGPSIHVFEHFGKIGLMNLCTHATAGQGIMLDFLVPRTTSDTRLGPLVQRRFCNSMDPFQPNDNQDFTSFKNKNNKVFYKPGVFIPLHSSDVTDFTVLHNPGVLNATDDMYIFYMNLGGIYLRRACLTNLGNAELYAGRILGAVSPDKYLTVVPPPIEGGTVTHFNTIPFQPSPSKDNTVHTNTSKQCHGILSALWTTPATSKSYMSCTVFSTNVKTGDLIYPTNETPVVIDCVNIEKVHVPFDDKTVLLDVSEYCVQYNTTARFAEVKTTTSGNLVCGLKGNVGTDMYSYHINIKYDRPRIQSGVNAANAVLIETTDLHCRLNNHYLRVSDIDTVEASLFGSKKTLKFNVYNDADPATPVLALTIAYTYALNGLDNDKAKCKVVETDLMIQLNDTGLFEVLYDNEKYDYTSTTYMDLIELLKEAATGPLYFKTPQSDENIGLCIDLTPYLGHSNYYGNTMYPQTVCTNNRSVEIVCDNTKSENIRDSTTLELWARNDPEMFLSGNNYSSGNIKPAPKNIEFKGFVIKPDVVAGMTLSSSHTYATETATETAFQDAITNAGTNGTLAVMSRPTEIISTQTDVLPCNNGIPLHNMAPSQFNIDTSLDLTHRVDFFPSTIDEVYATMNQPDMTNDCAAIYQDIILNKLIIVPGTLVVPSIVSKIADGSLPYGEIIYQKSVDMVDIMNIVVDFDDEMKKMLSSVPTILTDTESISYSLTGDFIPNGSSDYSKCQFQFVAIRWNSNANSAMTSCFTNTAVEYEKLNVATTPGFHTVHEENVENTACDFTNAAFSRVIYADKKNEPTNYAGSSIRLFESFSKCYTVFTKPSFATLTYGYSEDSTMSMFRTTLDRCILSWFISNEDNLASQYVTDWKNKGYTEEPTPYDYSVLASFGYTITSFYNNNKPITINIDDEHIEGGEDIELNPMSLVSDCIKTGPGTNAYMGASLTLYHTAANSYMTNTRTGRNKFWIFQHKTSWNVVGLMNAIFKYNHTSCRCSQEMEGIFNANDIATLTLYFFPYYDTDRRIQPCLEDSAVKSKFMIAPWINTMASQETTYITPGGVYKDIYIKHHYDVSNGIYTIKDVSVTSTTSMTIIESFANQGYTDEDVIQYVNENEKFLTYQKIVVNIDSGAVTVYEVSDTYTNFGNDVKICAGSRILFLHTKIISSKYTVDTYTGSSHSNHMDIQAIGTSSKGANTALCNTSNIQSLQTLYIPDLTSVTNHTFTPLTDEEEEGTQFLIITNVSDGSKYKLDHCTSEGSSDVTCNYTCIAKNISSGAVYDSNAYRLSFCFVSQEYQLNTEKTFYYSDVFFDLSATDTDPECSVVIIDAHDPNFNYNDSNIAWYMATNHYVAGCYCEQTGCWLFSANPSILKYLCYSPGSHTYCDYASQSSMPPYIYIKNATMERTYAGYISTYNTDDIDTIAQQCVSKGFSGFEIDPSTTRVIYYTKESTTLSDNRGAIQEKNGSTLFIMNDIDSLLYLHDYRGNNKLAIKNSFDRVTKTKYMHFDIGNYTLSLKHDDVVNLHNGVLEKCLSPTNTIQDFYAEWIHLAAGLRRKYMWLVDAQAARSSEKTALQISATARPFKNDGLSFQLTFFIPENGGDKLPILEIDNLIRIMVAYIKGTNEFLLSVWYYTCSDGSNGVWKQSQTYKTLINNKTFQFNHYYTMAFRTKHQLRSGSINLAKPSSSVGHSGMIEKGTLLPEINLDTIYETAPVDITGASGAQVDTTSSPGVVYAGPVSGGGTSDRSTDRPSGRRTYRDVGTAADADHKLLVDMVLYDTDELLTQYNNKNDDTTSSSIVVAMENIIVHESPVKAETAIRWDGNYNNLKLFECNTGDPWDNIYPVGMTRFVLFDGSEPLSTIAQCMSSKRNSANIALLFECCDTTTLQNNKTMDSVNPNNVLTCNNDISQLKKVPDELPLALIDDLLLSINGDILDTTAVFSKVHAHPITKVFPNTGNWNNGNAMDNGITLGKSMTMRVGSFNVYDTIVSNNKLKANRLMRKQCDNEVDPDLLYSFKNMVRASATTRAVEARTPGSACVLITNGTTDEHEACTSRGGRYSSDMKIRGNVSGYNKDNMKIFPPLRSDYAPGHHLSEPIVGMKVMSFYDTPRFSTLEDALTELNRRIAEGNTAITGVGLFGDYYLLKSSTQYSCGDDSNTLWLLDPLTTPENQKTLYNLPDISPIHWTSPNTVANTHFMLHSTEKPVYQYATDPSCPVEYVYNFVPHLNDNMMYDVVLYDMYVNNKTLHVSDGETVDYCAKMFLGNVQSNVTIEGFIEGAPPVPKSNMLSDGGDRNTDFIDYTNATQVSVALSKSISKTKRNATTSSDDFAMDMNFEMGAGTEMRNMLAPLGFGIDVKLVKADAGGSLGVYFGKTWGKTDNDVATTNVYDAVDMCMTGLNGYWPSQRMYPQEEVDKYGEYQFQPTNVGHLFVKSTTMDLYLLRSLSNGTILGKTKEATPESQEDINIIPFKISNDYIQQGSLDGIIGYDIVNSEVVTQDNGKTSYKKLAECYKEMSRIDSELLAAIDIVSGSTTAGNSGNESGGRSANNPGENAVPHIDESNMGSFDYKKLPQTMFQNAGVEMDTAKSRENIADMVLNAPDGVGSDAYVEYIWSNHGGMRMKNIGGACTKVNVESSSDSTMAAGQGALGFTVFAAAVHAGLSSNMGYVYNKSTVNDTETSGGKFATMSLTNTLPGNTAIWKLNIEDFSSKGDVDFKDACDANAGVFGNKYYDEESNVVYNNTTHESVNRIGTVNQYRGVSVFNNSSVNNASVLFDEVVDKEWMQNVVAADEFHPARALLEAESQKSSMKPWRVKHYVTYVEREQPETQAPDTSSNGTKYLLSVSTPIVRANLETLLTDATKDFSKDNVGIEADSKMILLESRKVQADPTKVCVYDELNATFSVYTLSASQTMVSAKQFAEEHIDISQTDKVYMVYSTEYIEITPTLSELSYYNNYSELSQCILGNVFPMSCLETTLKKFSKDTESFMSKKEKSKNWFKQRKNTPDDISKKRIIGMLNNMLMETAGMQHQLGLSS